MATIVNDVINGFNQGEAYKLPVKVSTTANITLSGLQTIDGISVVADKRVLVKDQTDPTENGIYIASASAWVRSKDFNSSRDIVEGTVVFCLVGTSNGGNFYRVTSTDDPIIFPSSNVTFAVHTSIDSAISITTYIQGLMELTTAEAVRTYLELKKNNYSAVGLPTVNDDSDDGYEIGSAWFFNQNMYYCVNATVGGAVWDQGDVVAGDLGASALKGIATLIDASSTDDDVATAKSVYDAVVAGDLGWSYDPSVATTSGTQITVTSSIPADATEVEVMFDVGGDGANTQFSIELGDIDGIETTGYLASAHVGTASTFSTTKIPLSSATVDASDTLSGTLRLSLQDNATFLWQCEGMCTRAVSGSGTALHSYQSKKALSKALSQIQISTSVGSFDTGSARVRWRK